MRAADKITLARMVILPIAWVYGILGYKEIFAIILSITVIGDIIDGYVARKTDNGTKRGAQIDLYADLITATSTIIFSIFLLREVMIENQILLLILLGIISLPFIFSFKRFRKVPSYHLISNKINAVIGYSFVVHALIFGYSKIFLYILTGSMVLNTIEKLILINKGKMNEHIKSVFE